jgi:type IX secretion system substrate protein/VWA domain-containing protein
VHKKENPGFFFGRNKKMKLMRVLFIVIALFAFVGNASSQSVEILDVNSENYPIVKLQYEVKDSEGNVVRNLSADDITLTDKNIEKELINNTPFCSEESKFSIIIVIDESASMWNPHKALSDGKIRFDAAIDAANMLIDDLPAGRFELSTYSFHSVCTNHQSFTDDKVLLKKSFEKIYEHGILTDYNSVFTRDFEGELGIINQLREAKYKPYVIFITDGLHKGVGNQYFDFLGAIDSMNAYSATVNSIIINPDGSASGDATALSITTGGQYYYSILSSNTILQAIEELLKDIAADAPLPPCYVEYLAACDGGDINFEVSAFGSASEEYTIDEELKPYLEIAPTDYEFVDVLPGGSEEIEIEITAKKNYVDIDGAIISDERYIVSDWGEKGSKFRLEKDESYTIKIKYSPTDETKSACKIEIQSSACESDLLELSAYITLDEQVQISDVDASGYPIIKVKFKVFAPNGDEIRNFSTLDLIVSDNDIQRELLEGSPDCMDVDCFFEYETDCDGGSIKLEVPGYGIVTIEYDIDEDLKPYLEITPRKKDFIDVSVSSSETADIQVTARNNYVDIDGSTISDPRYTIVKWGEKGQEFRLEKDESFTLTVEYTPTDSLLSNCKVELLGTACDSNWIDLNGYFSVGVDEYQNGSELVKLYPNPANDYLVIEFLSETVMNTPRTTFALVDNLGRKIILPNESIKSNSKSSVTLNIEKIPRGSYILIIENKEIKIANKVVIK